MKERNEADSKCTWKLEDMVAEDNQWEQMLREAAGGISGYASYKERLVSSAGTLYACLSFDDRLSQKIERLYVHARVHSDEDTTVQRYQDMFSRAQTLPYRAIENSSFLVPEILSMDRELLERYMVSDNGISHFKWALEIILTRRDHTLSAGIEELLAQPYNATQGASQIFTIFNNADMKSPIITGENGEDIQIVHDNYISLMENQNHRIRKDAFERLYSVYEQFSNTLAAAFSFNVKQTVFYARAKKYASSRGYYLAGNKVPELIYDNLVKAVWENITKLHKCTRVRGDMLGVSELHMYDLHIPMVAAVDRHYTYGETKAVVLEGLEPLGEEYLSLLRQGSDNRWIDVYRDEGKRGGAYSWGTHGSHPYVLLNSHGILNDVFILAHEIGHSIHTQYSDESQPFICTGYKTFVAEVASAYNGALLIRHLLEKTDSREEEAYLLNHFLEGFRGTLFCQTMFAEFGDMARKKVASRESLTAESLYDVYRQLSTDYFGPTMTVNRQIDYEWGRIPHFYTPFYVYQYAMGFSAVVAVSSRIMNGEPGALEGYRKFLGGGCSVKPIDLLKLYGMDVPTTRPMGETLDFFRELPEEFKACIHANE